MATEQEREKWREQHVYQSGKAERLSVFAKLSSEQLLRCLSESAKTCGAIAQWVNEKSEIGKRLIGEVVVAGGVGGVGITQVPVTLAQLESLLKQLCEENEEWSTILTKSATAIVSQTLTSINRARSDLIHTVAQTSNLRDQFVEQLNTHDMKLEPIESMPVGVVLRYTGKETNASPMTVSVSHLKQAAFKHGIVVLRGFRTLSEEELLEFSSNFGDLVHWDYGPLLHLKPDKKPTNFVMSHEALPVHWDVMFPPEYIEHLPYEKNTATFQMFQCVKSTPPGTGGETTFHDSRKILAKATKEEIEKWRNTVLQYWTKKSYFGGQPRSYPMIMKHPHTGDDILRYHPPWKSEIQLVDVKSETLSDAELKELTDDMQQRLFADDVYSKYQWHDGDLLLADNHYLLHGRTEIADTSIERHLIRVQVI